MPYLPPGVREHAIPNQLRRPPSSGNAPGPDPSDSVGDDGAPVDLRCSVAVMHGESVLLLRRERGDWVLPGGRPRPGETTVACARREVREETGLRVNPVRCAFVLEVIDPATSARIVELVFTADGVDPAAPLVGEPGSAPEWVHLTRLREIAIRPPIGGYLPALARAARSNTAPYLGNLWRPGERADWLADPSGTMSTT